MYGRAVSQASRRPDTTEVSLPDFTTLGLPETGAANTAVPTSAARRVSSWEVLGSMVGESTMIWGRVSPASTPVAPHVTSSTSSGPATRGDTMSRPANAAGEAATLAAL